MDAAAPALALRALGKTFASAAGPVEAIADIGFNVRPGEFVSVLGPSGCGKTTLLRMIGGLEKPTKGDVEISGRSVWRGAAETARALAFAFQEPRLFPWFSIEDNIAL
ncbi:MAG TPA: ATP-binding cassette domain-containing protein, partial [Beijerinckiaceae bacterium]